MQIRHLRLLVSTAGDQVVFSRRNSGKIRLPIPAAARK